MDFALALWGAAATDVSTWSTIGKITLNVVYVLLGINALIIVHEFGHFAVARMCGVRCEKFYIWFDFWGLKFFKFKWGNTEYGLGVFPLGGYVKMLGQEDNPGELRAEMERERARSRAVTDHETVLGAEKREFKTTVAATTISGTVDSAHLDSDPKNETPGEAPAHSLEELNEAIFAPDSYLSKSVPQRIAIISAGVVMNFLFAIVCATAAYMVGVKDTAPAVGNVLPGSPAWLAGLEVGDQIVAINGRKARAFMDINMAMVGGESGVDLTIRRREKMDGAEEFQTLEKTLIPRKRENDLAPTIGVTSLSTLEVVYPETVGKTNEWKPAYPWAEKYYSEASLEALKKPDLVLSAVNGVPVSDYAGYMDQQLRSLGQPIQCQFSTKSEPGKSEYVTFTATIPAVPMKETGVRFQMGPVTAVLDGSDANKKGLRPGDLILSVDGDSGFDPIKLPQAILQKVNAGQESVELVVRTGKGEEKTVRIELTPERALPELGPLSMKDPVGSTALGCSWNVLPVIAGVAQELPPGAPEDARKALDALPIGGKILSVLFVNCKEELLKANRFSRMEEDGLLFHEIQTMVDMPYIFDVMLRYADTNEPKPSLLARLQAMFKSADTVGPEEKEGKAQAEKKPLIVRLEVEDPAGAIKTYNLPVFDSADWFSCDRGMIMKAESAMIKIDDFGEALSLGTSKMVEYSMSVFTFLKRLINGNVSPRALGGPIMIVQAAWMFVERGLGSYLLFLCLIGANLAVINILPVPVLDGGHLVFLLYEGIFRKPPNETVQVVLSYIGLFLILTLMVWAISLDIGCVKRF